MRAIFPYVRVSTLSAIELPQPVTLIELDGLEDPAPNPERMGYLHSDLPMPWRLTAIRAALADVGIVVPDEFVSRGPGWLAWVDIDLSQPVPDLSRVPFARYLGVRNG